MESFTKLRQTHANVILIHLQVERLRMDHILISLLECTNAPLDAPLCAQILLARQLHCPAR